MITKQRTKKFLYLLGFLANKSWVSIATQPSRINSFLIEFARFPFMNGGASTKWWRRFQQGVLTPCIRRWAARQQWAKATLLTITTNSWTHPMNGQNFYE
jgi:hypothetical protein